MTSNEEVSVLTWLVKRVEVSSERADALSSRIRIGLWIALVVLFVFLFSFAQSGGAVVAIIGLGFCVVGLVTGLLLAYASGLRQWNVILPHVNRESVARRLNDLKPNT